MSHLIFIRHAETDMAGTFCGHSDPELNARGRGQLSGLIRELRDEQIAAVYTSDLRRAQSTAQAIASSFAVTYYLRPALREINFGRWEGLSWEEIERTDRAYAQRWMDDYPLLSAPDGELFADFERRVLSEIQALQSMAADRTIAIVTHAGVMRTVLRCVCGCSEKEAREKTQAYGAVFHYTVSLRENEVRA